MESQESNYEGDYESLPDFASFKTHMIAGAAAGLTEHCVMFPIDCVKTRMMMLNPDPKAVYRNVPHALMQIISNEGTGNTFRGIQAMAIGSGPAHALYFASYEKLKRLFSCSETGNSSVSSQAAAGALATLTHDITMNPFEVIKQRMQVYRSPYASCFDCATSVLKHEGFKAFYRSFPTQIFMNVPFGICHFTCYEFMQNQLNSKRLYDPKSHLLSGSIAGAFAAAITTPLDVCKTLFNTQQCDCVTNRKTKTNVIGIANCVKIIYNCKGLKGFFRGITARIIHQTPSTALSWSVYEFFKYFITYRQQAKCDGFETSTRIGRVCAQSEYDSWR